MLSRTFLGILFCLLCSTSVFSQELYEGKPIEKIQIVIDGKDLEETLSLDSILSRMKTKEGETFSQVVFDKDLKELSSDYQSVTPSIQMQGQKVLVTMNMKTRPVIHQIQFHGNEHFDTYELQKELAVEPNTLFDRSTFNQSFQKLKAFYVKKGYAEATLTYRIVPVDQDQVDIQIEIHEGQSGLIENVYFYGFSHKEEKELRSQIYLKRYNFLTNWVTEEGFYRDDAMEQDRMVILLYLQNLGFADAKVAIQRHENPETGQLAVWVVANRGPLYHFGKIQFEGNTLFPDKKIAKKLPIREGSVFSGEHIREAAQAVKDFYGQKGYIDANVQPDLTFLEEHPVAEVTFFIEEGRTYKVGLIHIFGNILTSNNVILRESLLVPGDTFDSRKLKATQDRLQGMGYFKNVNVYAVRTNEDSVLGDEYRDIYIEVEETSTGHFSLFSGFSSLDNIFGGVELTEQNFRIAGLRRAIRGDLSALRGGGEFFHLKATLGKSQNALQGSWMTPYLDDTFWRFGVDLNRSYSELQKHTKITSYGGSVYANYPLTNYWTAGIRHRLRYAKDRIDLDEAKDEFQATEESMNKVRDALDQRGLVSAVSANLSFDSTDNALKPHQGMRTYLEQEIAGAGGDYHFAKSSSMATIYLPANKKGTLKLRGELYYIRPFGHKNTQVPYAERLFLGGETSVRGFKSFSLGPMVVLKDQEGEKKVTDIAEGGLSSSTVSLEYSYEIFSALDAFAFFDMGSISRQALAIRHWQPTMGLGARLDIGNRMPIMVGWGIPLKKRDRHSGNWDKFFFSMSGQF